MAFINKYDFREDMQDDTYKIVAIRLDQALQSIIFKDVELAHSIIEALYLLIGSRLKEEKKVEDLLSDIANKLYGQEPPTPKQKSASLDAAKKVLKRITKELDDAGILFRAQADPNELYKRGGRG